MLKGIGASPGVAIGRALVLKKEDARIERRHVTAPEAEIEKLSAAVARSRQELERIREHALKSMGEDKAAIFEAHLMVLEDPEMISQTTEKIGSEKVNAEAAFDEVAKSFIAIFEGMKNEYMRARAADVRDVSGRVLGHLLGRPQVDLAVLDQEVILVANDLTPSETATMNREKVLGFLTDIGGKTSHSAIMARTLEVPAVVGLSDITGRLRDGQMVAFNGTTGEVFIDPEPAVVEKLRKIKTDFERSKAELKTLVGKESISLDGRVVRLEGNIGSPHDIESLQKNDAEGVGLFRTEFLYMDRDSLPAEEEQYKAYKAVLEAMGRKMVIIRTIDIGGDKELPYLKFDHEENPFLGVRAIRLCQRETGIFRTQIRALLRAGMHGNLGIMIPMVSTLSEIEWTKNFIAKTRAELESEKVPVGTQVKLGIMIEIPAAALMSDVLARHVDFFSIGTNDLTQYACAVDRMNEKISSLYDPYHPGVLRLIQMTIESAHKAGIPCGMCGEMAGQKEFIPLLLGMGLDDFSMGPASILGARKLVRSLKHLDMKHLAQEVLALPSGREVEARLKSVLERLG